MNYDWYQITNLDEFIESDLPSKEMTLVFPFGEKTLLFTKGNFVSVLYEGVFLPIGLNGVNPSSFDGLASFYDSDGVFWLGILHED